MESPTNASAWFILTVLSSLVLACGDDAGTTSGEGAASATGSGGDSSSGGSASTPSSSGTGMMLPDSEWTMIPFPSDADVFAVWAEASDKVWVGADDGLYVSRDGLTFESVELGMPTSIRDLSVDMFLAPIARAAGSSGAERLVLEYEPASETWTPFAWDPGYTLPKTGAPLGRVSSSGATFWVSSTDGSIAGLFDPTALFGDPNFYDTSMGDIVLYSAGVYGIAGPFSNRAYAGTSRGIMRYGGATNGPDNWTRQTEDITMADFLLNGDTFELWGVGTGIHRYDGEEARTWTELLADGAWTSIQQVGPELWVAGDGGLARSTDGTTFTTLALSPGARLNDVSGASTDDLWAVGPAGVVWRCVGAGCAEAPSLP